MRKISGVLAILALSVLGTAAVFQSSTMPVANYWLDEATGTTAFDYMGASNGNWVGNPVPVAAPLPPLSTNSPLSNCLDFDGTGAQYVEIPNVASLENIQEASYTLAAWVRPATTPPGTDPAYNANYAVIIKAGYHEGIKYMSNTGFAFDHWATGNVYAGTGTPGTHPPGSWYHVAAVWDRSANQVRLYVNGTMEGSATASAANREFAQNPWRIGIAIPGTGN